MKSIFCGLFLLFALCDGQEATTTGEYVLELNCTNEGHCLEILRLITQSFQSNLNISSNVTIESNVTGIHPIPQLLYQDYNECDDNLNYCLSNANCINVFRTFACECVYGYEGLPSTTGAFNCTDIDECSNSMLNNCTDGLRCFNTPGSYECRCPTGIPPPCSSSPSPSDNTTVSLPDITSNTITTPDVGSSVEETTSVATQGSLLSTTSISTFTNPTTLPDTSTSSTNPVATTMPSTSTPQTTSPSQTTAAPISTVTPAVRPITVVMTSSFMTTTIDTVTPTSELHTGPGTTINPDPSTSLISTDSIVDSTTIIQSTTVEITSITDFTTSEFTTSSQITRAPTTLIPNTPFFSTSTPNTPAPSTIIPTTVAPTTPALTTTFSSSLALTMSTLEESTTFTNETLTVPSTTTEINVPIIDPNDIINGEQDPGELIQNLTMILNGPPLSEAQAQIIVQVFDALAVSSEFVEPADLIEATILAERLLNTMILENGSFFFPSGSVAVGAIDVMGTRAEPLTYSISSGFDSSSGPSISLPALLFNGGGEQRVSFTGYNDASLFPVEGTASITNETFDFSQLVEDSVINSVVLGSALNGSEVSQLLEPVNIVVERKVLSVPDEDRDNSTTVRRTLYNPTCVFFNYSLRNGLGDWSSDGCTTVQSSGGEVNCLCNHLTSFAVLMSVETRIDDQILTILTYVGCSLSIFGLFASILTYSLFRHLRKHKSKQILLHFCVALSGVYIVYLFGITAAFPSDQAQCTATGFFLHFFTSATFAWMFIEVLDMYLLFVKVWSEISDPVKKASAFGWGFPLLLSIATLSAHFGLQNRYPGQDVPRLYPEYRSTAVCWLSTTGLYWAFFLPMGIILAINLVLFLIVLYHVTCKRANSKLTRLHSNSRRIKARQHVLNALAILLLSGPTWIIGFFINIDPISDGVLRRVLAYIFVILNAFQGLWIFIVFTVRPQAVRIAWWNLITGKSGLQPGSSSWGRRISKTSSTYLSRANRRKSSSAEMRRSSASSGVSAFKVTNSGKLRNLEVNTEKRENPSAKQYRYTANTDPSRESDSQMSSERNSNAGSDQNLVSEERTGNVNQTFNSNAGSNENVVSEERTGNVNQTFNINAGSNENVVSEERTGNVNQTFNSNAGSNENLVSEERTGNVNQTFNSNAGSNENVVSEERTGKVNPTFDSNERSSNS